MVDVVNSIIGRFLGRFVNYLPNFFGGLIILFIGLILSELLKRVLLSLIAFFRIEHILRRTKLVTKIEIEVWRNVLVEILKWGVVVLFLVPTLEVWGLSRATVVLNQVIFYIPNVIVAVIIGFVGLVMANLTADLVRQSVKTLGAVSAKTLAIFTKVAIIFFTILMVLSQLGVAQDLIRILFTGIVAMIAIAVGLAFGLGGQETAKEVLEGLKNKFKS